MYYYYILLLCAIIYCYYILSSYVIMHHYYALLVYATIIRYLIYTHTILYSSISILIPFNFPLIFSLVLRLQVEELQYLDETVEEDEVKLKEREEEGIQLSYMNKLAYLYRRADHALSHSYSSHSSAGHTTTTAATNNSQHHPSTTVTTTAASKNTTGTMVASSSVLAESDQLISAFLPSTTTEDGEGVYEEVEYKGSISSSLHNKRSLTDTSDVYNKRAKHTIQEGHSSAHITHTYTYTNNHHGENSSNSDESEGEEEEEVYNPLDLMNWTSKSTF